MLAADLYLYFNKMKKKNQKGEKHKLHKILDIVNPARNK